MNDINITPHEQITIKTIGNSEDGLLYLPKNYNEESSFPLIIFLHGMGENTLEKQVNQGLPKVIAQGKPPYANTSNGRVDFISLATMAGQWNLGDVSRVIAWAKENLKIDPNRIYLTGLSSGARSAGDYISHQDDENFEKVQAAVPMSYTLKISEMNNPSYMMNWNSWKGHGAWIFSGISDVHVDVTKEFARKVSEYGGTGRYTLYPGGHCCWPTYYDPEYRENINGKMMNIYEWMLQFTGAEQFEPVEEKEPISVESPEEPEKLEQPFAIISGGKHDNGEGVNTDESKITLDGSNSTGTIDSWHWGKLSGPDCHINNNGSTAEITELQEGDYVFYLSVSSSRIGWPSSDKVTVRVKQETLPITIKSIEVIYSDGSKSIFDDIECIDIDFKDGTNKIIQ